MKPPEAEGTSLGRRLRAAFTLLVLLVVLVGGAGAFTLNALAGRMENLSTRLTPAIEANADALQRMVEAESGLRSYQLTGDRAFLASYNAARNEVLGKLSRAEELSRQSGLDVDTTAAQQTAREWLELYAAPVVSGDADRTPATVRAGRTFEEFRAAQERAASQLTQERDRIRAESKVLRAVSRPALLLVTIACAVLAIVVARGTVLAVTAPLGELRGVLDRLRMGEHSARVPLTGPSEIRSVGAAANALADEGERLRSEQDTAAAMRRRTRAASLLVRGELDRAAVLRNAARALGTAVEVDGVVVRDLRTGGCAEWQRRTEGSGTADGIVSFVTPGADQPQQPDTELPLLRRLAEVNEVLHDPRGRTLAPIEGELDVIAAATLTTDRPRELDAERLRAVQSICADVGRALELSVVYEQQLELVDRLQELDRQKTDFLSTVSHELRTPLTSIRGYLELIRDGDAGPVPEPVLDMLDVVDRNAGRLSALIEDLLMLSRIESGTYGARAPALAEADVSAVVRGVVHSLLPQAATAGVSLVATEDPDGNAPRARIPEPELERAVLNLVANAVKHPVRRPCHDRRDERHLHDRGRRHARRRPGRRLRRGHRGGHGDRDPGRGPGAPVRPVLPSVERGARCGARHRAGAGDRAWRRPAPRGRGEPAVRPRRGDARDRPAAGASLRATPGNMSRPSGVSTHEPGLWQTGPPVPVHVPASARTTRRP